MQMPCPYRPLAEEFAGGREPGTCKGHVYVREIAPRDPADGSVLPSLFLMETPASLSARLSYPHPYLSDEFKIPCTRTDARRLQEAARAYATAVDAISIELGSAQRRAARAPWWRPVERRRARKTFEDARRRYVELTRAASEDYEPVRQEVRKALRKARARAEKAREKAEEFLRKERQKQQAPGALRRGRGNPSGGTATGGSGGFTGGGFTVHGV
jgi:hypothetical protein